MGGVAVIDFETRSRVDLKKTSAYVYAVDDSTDVNCLAVSFDGARPVIWTPPRYGKAIDPSDRIVEECDRIVAHNADFDAAIWRHVMVEKYGWKPLPGDKLVCTAAMAASCGMPRSLGPCADEAKTDIRKDKAGYLAMMKTCKPQKDGTWCEDPETLRTLFTYAGFDVRATWYLYQWLERKVPWASIAALRAVDRRINLRGVAVDLEGCRVLRGMTEAYVSDLLEEFAELTDGKVGSPTQIQATIEYLREHEDIDLPHLTKATVSGALAGEDVSPKARRLLEIRQTLARASVAKISAMEHWSCRGRIRGSLMFCGAATTGRWSGKGVQPQNMLRAKDVDVEGIVKASRVGHDLVRALYGDPMAAAGSCVRGMLIPKPGRKFVCGDWRAIEGRVLAWLAREDTALRVYAEADPYIASAMLIYPGVPYDEITKDQRFVGKVAELALGYQGGPNAFITMARLYGIDVKPEEAQNIVSRWRENRPGTVALWREVQKAVWDAIEEPWSEKSVARVVYTADDQFLRCLLPSGRKLFYRRPHFAIKPGEERPSISYWGQDSKTHRWCEQWTYGGKLVENIVQAISRDILAAALLRLDGSKYDVVLHIHDEILAEADMDAPLQPFLDEMVVSPKWAVGLPLAVEGWEGLRYRKE